MLIAMGLKGCEVLRKTNVCSVFSSFSEIMNHPTFRVLELSRQLGRASARGGGGDWRRETFYYLLLDVPSRCAIPISLPT